MEMKLDLIMIDECGDEVKVETFNVGDELDEDYMELWKDRKIEKARENYPEAQQFYFERPYSDMSYGELLACGNFQKVRLSDMDVKEYILTEKGRKECEIFISELKAKRKEILDAGIDTADGTFVDYTPEELFEDLLDFGIDEDGEIYNGYGVTDHYDADRAFGLKFGEDFIEVKNQQFQTERMVNLYA